MREASLLAAKFFKELADVFGDEDGHGKYFGKNSGYPRHAQIFCRGRNPPGKMAGRNFSRIFYQGPK